MTRYYYTDPLAVLWMRKHFNMQFVDKNGYQVSIDPLLADCSIRHGQDVQWFVHPDSLHVLQFQIGDIVCPGYGIYGKVCEMNPSYSGDLICLIDRGAGGPWDTPRYENVASELSGISPIIQRDGKPFFWPEREVEP